MRVARAVGWAVMLCSMGLTAATSAKMAQLDLAPDYANAPFLNGVGSADPTQDSVLIWTRVTTATADVTLNWFVWEIVGSNDVLVSNGTAPALRDADFTVTVEVSGLKAGTYYHYQFEHPGGNVSALGRTKTLIDGSVSSFNYAVLSCTSLWSGYFNAYGHISQRDDIDFVVHLGDYVYPDVDPDECYRIPNGLCDYRWWRRCTKQIKNYASLPPNGDSFFDAFVASFNCSGNTLERYRWVHSLYLFDPQFRAARQNHPFITVVDDHDTDDENDVFEDGLQAFLEYVPTRIIRRANNTVDLYRYFEIGGNLMDLIVLDTRTQLTEESLLGPDQDAWLKEALRNSSAKNTQWRAIAQTKMFMPLGLNNLGSVGISIVFTIIWAPAFVLLLIAAGLMYRKSRRGETLDEEKMKHYSSSLGEQQPGKVKVAVAEVNRCWTAQGRPTRICYRCCCVSFLLFTLIWIAGVAFINSQVDKDNHVSYLDDEEDGWGGRHDSVKQLYAELESENCDNNNIFLSGDMHMSLAADVIDFEEVDKRTLYSYDPYSSDTNKRYGVEFLPTSGSRGNLNEKAEEITGLSVSDPLNQFASSVANFVVEISNPHFRYFEGTQHGYGVVKVTTQALTAEFWYTDVLTQNAPSERKKSMRLPNNLNRWE